MWCGNLKRTKMIMNDLKSGYEDKNCAAAAHKSGFLCHIKTWGQKQHTEHKPESKHVIMLWIQTQHLLYLCFTVKPCDSKENRVWLLLWNSSRKPQMSITNEVKEVLTEIIGCWDLHLNIKSPFLLIISLYKGVRGWKAAGGYYRMGTHQTSIPVI